MSRVRSFQVDAVREGATHTGLGNFVTPNIHTPAGRAALDVFAAITARVTVWNFTIMGQVDNSSADFTTSSVLSGSTEIAVGTVADENEFAQGMENYPIRLSQTGTSDFDCTTSLSMAGASPPQPFAPGTLNNETGSWAGPELSALDTAGDIGTAEFIFSALFSSTESTNGDGSPTYPRAYRVSFSLTTDPTAGAFAKVLIGQVIVRIPKWYDGSGNNDFSIPLYLDLGLSLEWVIVGNNGGGGSTYSGTPTSPSGDVTITMTPVDCYEYQDADGVPAWNPDGTPAIPVDQLLAWLP